MLLHIPHSSTDILQDVEVSNLQENLNLLTDWFTDELFFHEAGEPIIFKYSRLCIDVERLPENEPMEKSGQGILYEKDAFGDPIKRKNADFMMKLYHEHHYFLNQRTGWTLAYFPKAFIVDCHSFLDGPTRPDICLGIGQYTPKDMYFDIRDYFSSHGLYIAFNIPYEGSIMPHGFENNSDVKSIMIEVNKKLYLDDKYKKNSDFKNIQNLIEGALDIIYEYEERNIRED